MSHDACGIFATTNAILLLAGVFATDYVDINARVGTYRSLLLSQLSGLILLGWTLYGVANDGAVDVWVPWMAFSSASASLVIATLVRVSARSAGRPKNVEPPPGLTDRQNHNRDT